MSKTGTRYWLRRYGLKTNGTQGRPEARAARRNGQSAVEMVCKRHGLTEFVLEGRGYYRCGRCRWEAVVRYRRTVKQRLVNEAGGACVACGYDRHLGALEFHHLDRTTKRFELATRGLTKSLERLRAEAAKCILLCSNCHAEVEAGVRVLPQK